MKQRNVVYRYEVGLVGLVRDALWKRHVDRIELASVNADVLKPVFEAKMSILQSLIF